MISLVTFHIARLNSLISYYMQITLEIVRKKIASYLKNELSLSSFRDWSFKCLMAEDITYDSTEHDLASRIISLIDDESLNEENLRHYLNNINSRLEEENSFEHKEKEILNMLNNLQKH